MGSAGAFLLDTRGELSLHSCELIPPDLRGAQYRFAGILLDLCISKKQRNGHTPVFRTHYNFNQPSWKKPKWPKLRPSGKGLPAGEDAGVVVYDFMANHNAITHLPNYEEFRAALYPTPETDEEGQPIDDGLPSIEERCLKEQFSDLNLWDEAVAEYARIQGRRDEADLVEDYRKLVGLKKVSVQSLPQDDQMEFV